MKPLRQLLPVAFVLVLGCQASEPATVDIPVEVSTDGVAAITTAEGYAITVQRMRLAIADLELTIEGEEHETEVLGDRDIALLHPGHAAGGEVTGELPGDLLVETTTDGAVLGVARLIVGDYHGANFTFRTATAADGLAPDDPLLGHTAHLELDIARDDETWSASVVLDVDAETQLVGAPFEMNVDTESADGARLAFTMYTANPTDGARTMFDGVDFAALDVDADGVITVAPGETAHNKLRRPLQTHDHYAITER